MGKKIAVAAKAAKKGKAAPKRDYGAEIDALKARQTESEGDFARIVELLGGQCGEPFKSAAKEIVEKRQGAAPAPKPA